MQFTKRVTSGPCCLLVLLLLLSSQPSPSYCANCLLSYPRDVCFSLFTEINNTIRNDPRNIYELVQYFYPQTRFYSTQFVNVLYTLTYNSDDPDLPLCEQTFEDSRFLEPGETNQFLQGWSKSGVFNIISPFDLSQIQSQLMNEMLSLFIVPGAGIALPGNFGWLLTDEDGRRRTLNTSNYRVNINLNVESFPCKPSVRLAQYVLQDMTIMVSQSAL